MTATRLQLIAEVERVANEAAAETGGLGAPLPYLVQRLKTLKIKLPDTMIVARCTCDDPGEGPCPRHGREIELQAAVDEHCRQCPLLAGCDLCRKCPLWKRSAKTIAAAGKPAEGEADRAHGPICTCGHPRHVHPVGEDQGTAYRGGCLLCQCAGFERTRKDGTDLGPGWGQR